MESLYRVDWQRLFVPQLSLLEMLLRGVLVFLLLCFLLRVVLKRQAGKIALSDLLVLTLVTGICRNPLVADAYSIPDGLGVVTVILGVSFAVDWLSFRSRVVHTLLHPEAVLLIRDGVVRENELKRELLTLERLRCKLRGHGVSDINLVAEAWLEGDGQVSVIRRDDRGFRSRLPDNDSVSLGHDSIASHGTISGDPADLWELASRLEQGLRQKKPTFGSLESPP